MAGLEPQPQWPPRGELARGRRKLLEKLHQAWMAMEGVFTACCGLLLTAVITRKAARMTDAAAIAGDKLQPAPLRTVDEPDNIRRNTMVAENGLESTGTRSDDPAEKSVRIPRRACG